MSGTFSSFNTALSALRYQRIAMDVASNNTANVTTPGYTRRRLEAESVGAPTQPARWSRYDGAGGGVAVASLGRLVDPFLDMRSRREHGKQAFLDGRVEVLNRVESGIGEPGDNGVSAALTVFRSAWQDLANHPDTDAARGQVIETGRSLADAVNTQATNLDSEISDQRSRMLDLLTEVNTAAADLASVNRSVAGAQLDGTDNSDLLDQRDQLALRLAQLTGGVAATRPDGGLDFTINGASLVSGSSAGHLVVTSGITADGAADGSPLSLAVTSGATSTAVPTAALGGETGAVADLLTATLPAYRDGLNAVAAVLADAVNSLHTAGYDRSGAPGAAFFSYDPADAAGSLRVAITDPNAVAASGLPGGVADGSNADALGAASAAEPAYQRLVNGFGTQIQSATRLASTQQLLTTQVDSAREQLVGVNLDEETVNLLAAQRAYEAASRVMSTLDSVLDTLINRTGVTH